MDTPEKEQNKDQRELFCSPSWLLRFLMGGLGPETDISGCYVTYMVAIVVGRSITL